MISGAGTQPFGLPWAMLKINLQVPGATQSRPLQSVPEELSLLHQRRPQPPCPWAPNGERPGLGAPLGCLELGVCCPGAPGR